MNPKPSPCCELSPLSPLVSLISCSFLYWAHKHRSPAQAPTESPYFLMHRLEYLFGLSDPSKLALWLTHRASLPSVYPSHNIPLQSSQPTLLVIKRPLLTPYTNPPSLTVIFFVLYLPPAYGASKVPFYSVFLGEWSLIAVVLTVQSTLKSYIITSS